MPCCDSLILFLRLSYPTTTAKATLGYCTTLYFHSLFSHSDFKYVCKFDIWLDIRARIFCINAFSTTFLQNLFVTVHIEIPFSFKATIKNICIVAITILNFDFHGPLRLLRALVRRTGCTPSRGAWCDPLAGTGSEQDPLLLKNAFRMTLIFDLNFIAFALRNVDFELQTFQSQSFGFGVIFEHRWFASCDDILQQVCFSFKAFEDVLTGAQPGGPLCHGPPLWF